MSDEETTTWSEGDGVTPGGEVTFGEAFASAIRKLVQEELAVRDGIEKGIKQAEQGETQTADFSEYLDGDEPK